MFPPFLWGWSPGDYVDVSETWEVTMLCASTELASLDGPQPGKPIFLKSFSGLGHDVYKPTEYPTSAYACGIAGFFNTRGDINEKDDRDPIEVYTYPQGGYWNIRAGFATHRDEKQDWTVNLMCVSTEMAAVGGPQPGKPYFLKTLPRFNDPAGGTTGVPDDKYACGTVGFRAFAGNIDEHEVSASTPLFWAYLHQPGDGTWHFRGDFRSEGNHEDWEKVSILCAARDSDPVVNQLPVIIAPAIQYHHAATGTPPDGVVTFSVSAADLDWDRVSLTVSAPPTGARFDITDQSWSQVRGQFSWRPPAALDDTWKEYPTTFAASDQGQTSYKTVAIRVCGPRIVDCVNLTHLPRISPVPPQTVKAGNPLTFKVSATDKDEDRILLKVRCGSTEIGPRTRRCDTDPVGAEFTITREIEGRTEGTFAWTPLVPGTYPVGFLAHDGVDGQDVITVNVTVTAGPPPEPIVWAPGGPTTATPSVLGEGGPPGP